MVRGIYGDDDCCARARGSGWLLVGRNLSRGELNISWKAAPYDPGQPRLGLNVDFVGDLYLPSCLVIHGCSQVWGQEVGNVLDERTATVNVQTLQAVANAEHGLAHVVCILQQKLVDGIAARIGGRGWGRACGIELRGIYICLTAR